MSAISPPPYQQQDDDGAAHATSTSSLAARPSLDADAEHDADQEDPVDLHLDAMADSIKPSPPPIQNAPESYWLATSTSPGANDAVHDSRSSAGPWPAQDDVVDVAIIGSGITGVSAAYHCATKLPRNARVAILEARDFCSGATGRNGGHLTATSALSYLDMASNATHLANFLGMEQGRTEVWGNDVGQKTDETIRRMLTLEARTVAEILMMVRMESIKKARENGGTAATAASSSSSAWSDDPELICGSNWHLCFSTKEVDAYLASIEAAKRAGLGDFALQVRRVPDEEWQQRLHEPAGVAGVFEIPGGTVHPRRLVAMLWRKALDKAKSKGIDLNAWVHTPVQRVEAATSSSSPTTLHTKRGPLRARYVIHATNGYVSHLLPDQFTGPRSGVVPTRGQCIAIRPSPTSAHPSSSSTTTDRDSALWSMGFSLNRGYEYLQQRPTSVRHLGTKAPCCILGGGRESAKGYEWNVADDSTFNANVSAALRPMLSHIFPNDFDPQRDAEVDLEWTGIMGFTKTKDPFVGPVPKGPPAMAGEGEGDAGAVPGQYVSAGYSGHGMSRAFSCAEVVVDMIVAEEQGEQWEAPSW